MTGKWFVPIVLSWMPVRVATRLTAFNRAEAGSNEMAWGNNRRNRVAQCRVAQVARNLWAKHKSPRADGEFSTTAFEHLRRPKADSCAYGTPVASNRCYPAVCEAQEPENRRPIHDRFVEHLRRPAADSGAASVYAWANFASSLCCCCSSFRCNISCSDSSPSTSSADPKSLRTTSGSIIRQAGI